MGGTAGARRDGFPSLGGAHVLLVEDDPEAAALFATVLEWCGALVSAVTSAAAAVQLLEHITPHVLVAATGRSPEQARPVLRTLGGRAPALALSSDRSESAADRARAAGFDACLIKPVGLRDLCQAVARLALPRPR